LWQAGRRKLWRRWAGGAELWQKQAVALIGETKLWMPYNQQKYHDERENPIQEWVVKLLLAKNCGQMNFFQILIAYAQNSMKVLLNHLHLLLQGLLLLEKN
jgi:hypothetical protein